MSSYRGSNIFGSGPHRFSVGVRGQEVQPLWRLYDNPLLPGSQAIGDVELEIVVTGRLVAASESGLWALRQAIADTGAFSLGPGTLVDNGGCSFTGMRLVTYTEEDRVCRGRVWSMGYEARFRRTSD